MGEDRPISDEEFSGWIIPRSAVAALYYLDRDTAILQIYERLRYGNLLACARKVYRDSETLEFSIIFPETWANSESGILESSFWDTGDMTLYTMAPVSSPKRLAAFFGVRLDPVEFAQMVHTPPPSTHLKAESLPSPISNPEKVTAPERRGRPPKEWWGDLWVEMCRQIYAGDLQPKTQADIERAMLNWATSNEHEMSEATARKAARKLFPIFEEEG